MGWLSILPESLSTLETWAVRTFILLGLLTICPWALLVVYDILLYFWRTATYELPYLGGRARGRQRPRAPSLMERPSGSRRRFSLMQAVGSDDSGVEGEGVRRRGVERGNGDGLREEEY